MLTQTILEYVRTIFRAVCIYSIHVSMYILWLITSVESCKWGGLNRYWLYISLKQVFVVAHLTLYYLEELFEKVCGTSACKLTGWFVDNCMLLSSKCSVLDSCHTYIHSIIIFHAHIYVYAKLLHIFFSPFYLRKKI